MKEGAFFESPAREAAKKVLENPESGVIETQDAESQFMSDSQARASRMRNHAIDDFFQHERKDGKTISRVMNGLANFKRTEEQYGDKKYEVFSGTLENEEGKSREVAVALSEQNGLTIAQVRVDGVLMDDQQKANEIGKRIIRAVQYFRFGEQKNIDDVDFENEQAELERNLKEVIS